MSVRTTSVPSSPWEGLPAETWISKWLPLPPEIHRGPYRTPTRGLLVDVEAGLERIKRRLNDER
jgi:hypothetical protein